MGSNDSKPLDQDMNGSTTTKRAVTVEKEEKKVVEVPYDEALNEVPSKAKWYIHSVKRDDGFMPTLGFSLWLGWNAVIIYVPLYLILLASNTERIVGATILAVWAVLPRTFIIQYVPHSYQLGNWIIQSAEKYAGMTTIIEDRNALHVPDRYDDEDAPKKKSKSASKAAAAAAPKSMILPFEPHDILPWGILACSPYLGHIPGRIGRNLRALLAGFLFRLPFIRQFYTLQYCDSVGKSTFRALLQQGRSIVFIPGGVQEVTLIHKKKRPQDIVLFLMARKGFVKMALEHGAPVVPIFCFGQDFSFTHWVPTGKWAAAVGRQLGMLPLVWWGQFGMPYGLPKSTDLRVVMGRPIPFPPGDDLSSERIEMYHDRYVREVKALYERHRKDAGYGDRDLVIV